MNIFNRVVVVLEVLLLIILLIIAAVVPNTVLERLLYTMQQLQSALQVRWPMSYVLFLVVAIVLILLLVLLLWLELRPQGRKTVTVRTDSGTQAEVSTSSVEQSLQHRISEIADVLKVRPVVRGKRGGVDIVIDLETTPEIDIPTKMDEVSQVARELIESKMGLRITNVKVRVRQAPYGKVKAPPPPTTPPSITVEPVGPETPEQSATQPTAEDSGPYSQL